MRGPSAKDLEITPIVAYGLVIMMLILGGLALDKLWRAEMALETRLITAQNELATLEALQGDNPWGARFTQSQTLKTSVTQRLWTGQTAGLIAADLQQALRRDAGALGFDSIQVRVDPELVDVDGKDVMAFEFAGRAPDGKAVASMMEIVAKHNKHIVMRDVDFSQNIRDRRPPRFAFSGIIPVQISSANAEATQNTQPADRPALDPMIAPSPEQRVTPRDNKRPQPLQGQRP